MPVKKFNFLLDIHVTFFKHEIDAQKRLAEEMEKYFKDELEKFESLFDSIKDPEELDRAIDAYDGDTHFYTTAINSFRESQVLGIFSLFEKQLERIAHACTDNVIKVGDLNGSLTKRIKVYLRKNLGDDVLSAFQDNSWTKVNDYVKVRNYIAHEYGEISEDKLKAVNNLRNVEEKNGKVVLREGFCNTMLDDLYDFIVELRDVIKSITQKKPE